MIHTDEEDEFERIEREQKMKGQPYHWEADAIKAAVKIEREACARLCEYMASRCDDIRVAALEAAAENIRARGNT